MFNLEDIQRLSEIKGERINNLFQDFRKVRANILGNIPEGRECALALTNLEQSYFWAFKAIVENKLKAEEVQNG